MTSMVKSFNELTPELQAVAGGKGGVLARMFQNGYPVPEGFVILPSAFQGDELHSQAWNRVQTYLHVLRKKNEKALFAVRSSALSEDSAQASFAGEFETVLNVKTDKEIQEAIYKVYKSGQSERVKAYSAVQGLAQSHEIAVVVQIMIPSEISGVLFTVDPVTGSFASMVGNFVYGLGEQLVSGEANPCSFNFGRPKGEYDGPEEFKKYSARLYKLAVRLETDLGSPLDIEWAVAGRKIYILQARPVTTLQSGNWDTYELNYSMLGDYLWSNSNVAEAVSDVVTPFTWSILQKQDEAIRLIPGYYLWANICGRMYSNFLSTAAILGNRISSERVTDIFGKIPKDISFPVYPFSKWNLLKKAIPKIIQNYKEKKAASKHTAQFLKGTPDWCRRFEANIRKTKTMDDLLYLWQEVYQPYNYNTLLISMDNAQNMVTVVNRLSIRLKKLVGTEDSGILLSNLRGGSELASLGPLVGIAKVVKGEKSREEYLQQYGHRCPNELELSIPDPAEDASWLQKQIEEFEKSNTDIEGLLKKQHRQFEAARKRFADRFPNKVKWLDKQLEKAAEAANLREATRSEYVRVIRVIRTFILKAGELSGIGDKVFFLYIDEVLNLLSGDNTAVKHIPARIETYNKYKSLPAYPSIIRGRFDPFEWEKDPNRRMDYYDATIPAVSAPESEILKGYAGATGRIEGNVRILTTFEEGEQLQPGEILVAFSTNVGWTPLFPKAAAIITDIGAPLSHAAIVARELGIPAVVGCGNATTRLHTGDRVIVDGGKGVVHILAPS